MKTEYIAYIDEAGDTGLKNITKRDQSGATEWLILSAVVVRAENEEKVKDWIREIRIRTKCTQGPSLHYRKLAEWKKERTCEMVSNLPLRIFITAANKTNMEGYNNRRAAFVSNTKQWLYWWLTRLLLERVTEFCEDKNKLDGIDGKLRIELSRRGGMSYIEFRNYLSKLWLQSRQERLYIDRGNLSWSVVDNSLIKDYPHYKRAGLQFADIAASAFYQALSPNRHGQILTTPAISLKPRIWRKGSNNPQLFDRGFKLMPPVHDFKKLNLSTEQWQFLDSFGFPTEKR